MWQATIWSWEMGVNSGISALHWEPKNWLQRVLKTQPLGRSKGDGISPGMGVNGESKSSNLGKAFINP
jgi:hypothetical protein